MRLTSLAFRKVAMFTKNSRYANTPTVNVSRGDTEVTALKLRKLPDTTGAPVTVSGADQLDVIADRCFQDGTQYWHVADANTELDAHDILQPVGRTILVPER